MKPMTNEEIETELNALIAHAQQHAGSFGCTVDVAMSRLSRAAYTLGSDNGQARILEAADRMLGERIADAGAASMLRSLSVIERWCAIRTPGEGLRSYSSGPTVYTELGRQWRITGYGGMTQRHFFGASQADALAQFAQWCEGDMLPAEPTVVSNTMAEWDRFESRNREQSPEEQRD